MRFSRSTSPRKTSNSDLDIKSGNKSKAVANVLGELFGGPFHDLILRQLGVGGPTRFAISVIVYAYRHHRSIHLE